MEKNKLKKIVSLIIPTLVMLFNVFILLNPREIILCAKEGIDLWINTVFPSLFPFIIGANILTGLGFVNFMGTLLEPVMQPLFGVPGHGSFALMAGLTSGYPVGAKVTGDLRAKNQITKHEAQRLLSFTNNSGPLFILGAVGVGLFKSITAGYFIMTIHYGAAIINGLLFKSYKKSPPSGRREKNLFRKSYQSMLRYRQKEDKTIGQLLSDSVKNAMETILQIGGFIILFCVLVKILELTNFISVTRALLSPVLGTTDSELYEGIFTGIIEMTNGAKKISSLGLSAQNVIACSALISFGGFSIHAQSINFLQKTDISFLIYILSKTSHTAITVVLGFLLFPFFDFSPDETVTVFLNMGIFDKLLLSSLGFFLGFLAVFVLSSFVAILIKKFSRQ